MEKTTFSLFITLLLLQWQSIFVESADTVEAKVSGAMQKNKNSYIGVVEDEDTKSGWAVDVKRAIKEKESNDHYAYFYTRTDPKAKFELSYAASLCQLLKANNGKSKFLPVQVTAMIFPRQKTSCDFKVRETAIRATTQVNTNADDNGGYLPKTTPYEMEVQILNNRQALDDKGDYLIKVNFNIGGDINKS